MTKHASGESPAQLVSRFGRALERQDCAVYAINAESLPGSVPTDHIGGLVRWALDLLVDKGMRGSPSFGVFVKRRLHAWFTGQQCACLYLTASDSGPTTAGVGLLRKQLKQHPGFVEAESATWQDPHAHLVAYYDRKSDTLYRSAPPAAVFLPSSANLASSDDGEWVLTGIRDSPEGEWLEQYVAMQQTGSRLFDDRSAIEETFGALYTPLLLRLTPLQRVRLGRLKELPDVGSATTWDILTHALDLDGVQQLLDSAYAQIGEAVRTHIKADWDAALAEDSDVLRDYLREQASAAVAHLRVDGALDPGLGASAAVKVFLQLHTLSGCEMIMVTDDQGRLIAVNFVSDDGFALIEGVEDVGGWILEQTWETIAHETVQLAPLLAAT